MLYHYNSTNEFGDLQKEFSKLFDGFEKKFHVRGEYPLTNVCEQEDEFKVCTLLPGINPSEVDITYDNGILTITGEKKSDLDKIQKYLRQERSFGKFNRSLKVRVAIDPNSIKANYKNGVLTIHLKKAEEAIPVKIKIK